MNPKEMTILAVGAHAGDMELSAGGLIATVTALGGRAALLHLTPGEKGHPAVRAEDYARHKRDEACRAAEILGAEVIFLEYRDAELPVSEQVQHGIADVIRRTRPTHIITHPPESIHRDHSRAHRNVMDSLLYAGLREFAGGGAAPWSPHAVLFAENWEDSAWEPYMYFDITPGFERWREAISAYQFVVAEWRTFPYLDYYLSLARVRGCLARCRYAEAFDTTLRAKRRIVGWDMGGVGG